MLLITNIANGKTLLIEETLSFKCIVDSAEVTLNAFIAPWLQTEYIFGVPFVQQYREVVIPIISHEVKPITPKKYFKVINAIEARRELYKSTTQTQLFWIITNHHKFDNYNDIILDACGLNRIRYLVYILLVLLIYIWIFTFIFLSLFIFEKFYPLKKLSFFETHTFA